MPVTARKKDTIGIFAATVEMRMETEHHTDPYQQMMVQTLADRLAEATTEKMHQEVRTKYWGYAPNEQLSIEEILRGAFQGIRPAVGYPSMPDASINFLIQQIIDMGSIGIHLTEHGAMRPHASVSGLMIAHPKARYFDVGPVGNDQLADYAHRRGIPLELARKFLASNLI
jgi:cobalamin-dependent methionine synthase I